MLHIQERNCSFRFPFKNVLAEPDLVSGSVLPNTEAVTPSAKPKGKSNWFSCQNLSHSLAVGRVEDIIVGMDYALRLLFLDSDVFQIQTSASTQHGCHDKKTQARLWSDVYPWSGGEQAQTT